MWPEGEFYTRMRGVIIMCSAKGLGGKLGGRKQKGVGASIQKKQGVCGWHKEGHGGICKN